MMCPQMFEEGKTYNGIDADIFSLGVLLYQLVTSGRGFLHVNRNSYINIKDEKYILSCTLIVEFNSNLSSLI